MVTPAIRALKAKHPKAKIDMACFSTFTTLFLNNPDINEVIANPIEVSKFLSYDAIVWLDDDYEEEAELGKTMHAVDRVFKRIDLPAEDRSLSYTVTPEEKAATLERFPRTKKKRIVCQMTASEPARTWPRKNLSEFIVLADKKGYEVFLVGWPDESGFQPPLSIRESAALVATADGVVVPDSLWFHVASALKKPGVGIFAAFDAKLRSTSDTIFNINGRVGCEIAPCFHHSGRPGVHSFPVEGPCNRAGYCCAMAEVAPDRVLALLEREMERQGEAQ